VAVAAATVSFLRRASSRNTLLASARATVQASRAMVWRTESNSRVELIAAAASVSAVNDSAGKEPAERLRFGANSSVRAHPEWLLRRRTIRAHRSLGWSTGGLCSRRIGSGRLR